MEKKESGKEGKKISKNVEKGKGRMVEMWKRRNVEKKNSGNE